MCERGFSIHANARVAYRQITNGPGPSRPECWHEVSSISTFAFRWQLTAVRAGVTRIDRPGFISLEPSCPESALRGRGRVCSLIASFNYLRVIRCLFFAFPRGNFLRFEIVVRLPLCSEAMPAYGSVRVSLGPRCELLPPFSGHGRLCAALLFRSVSL